MILPVLEIDVPLSVVLCFVSIILIYWYGTSTFDAFEKDGIPYRTPLIPCLGTIIPMFTKPLHIDDVMTRERFPTKVYGAFHARVPVLEVADATFVKQVMIKHFSKLVNRRQLLSEDSDGLFYNNILGMTNDHWKHVRSLLTPTFTSGKLKQMLPVIEVCAGKLVAHMRSKNGAPIVVKEYTGGYTMDVIASTGFGMDIDSQITTNHPFVANAGAFFGLPKDQSMLAKFKQTLNLFILLALPQFITRILSVIFDLKFPDPESSAYFEGIIKRMLSEQREKSMNNNDFISMCSDKLIDIDTVDNSTVRLTDGRKWSTQGLTEKEIVGNATIFLSAGYETTATALQFFFYNMAVHPDIQSKLHETIRDAADQSGSSAYNYEVYQKLQYLDWCINESLRIFPPVVRVDRQANEETVINGIPIPKGRIVNILIYAMHHDPDYWPKPDVYNPERFSPENMTEIQQQAFLPFGAGNRSCIAMRLALLEIRVAIVKTMTAFRFEKTAETPDKIEFKIGSGGFLMTKTPLKISAVPRDI